MELTDYRNLERLANPYTVKCILLGDRGVGKSTLLGVLITGHFDQSIESTIGIDFGTKKITLAAGRTVQDWVFSDKSEKEKNPNDKVMEDKTT